MATRVSSLDDARDEADEATAKIAKLEPKFVGEAHKDAYCRQVGFGKRFSVVDMASKTQAEHGTHKNYHEKPNCPNLSNFLRNLIVLGPEYGNQILALAGYSLVPTGAGAGCHFELNEKVMQFAVRLAEALTDERSPGAIDHIEELDLDALVAAMKPHVDAVHAKARTKETIGL